VKWDVWVQKGVVAVHLILLTTRVGREECSDLYNIHPAVIYSLLPSEESGTGDEGGSDRERSCFTITEAYPSSPVVGGLLHRPPGDLNLAQSSHSVCSPNALVYSPKAQLAASSSSDLLDFLKDILPTSQAGVIGTTQIQSWESHHIDVTRTFLTPSRANTLLG